MDWGIREDLASCGAQASSEPMPSVFGLTSFAKVLNTTDTGKIFQTFYIIFGPISELK